MSKPLADLSMEMWTLFRAAGLKTRVKCSKDSLSRYVISEGAFTIRLSDHEARHDKTSFDYEIIVRPKDDVAKKMREARQLVEQLVGSASASPGLARI